MTSFSGCWSLFKTFAKINANTWKYLSGSVKIVEVGPRDGLQNESKNLSIDQRLLLINYLADSGLKEIEVGSFVSKKWVPQMAETGDLYKKLNINEKVTYTCLVPNEKGLQSCIECGCKSIAVFTAASQTFCRKNINTTIEDSLVNIEKICEITKKNDISVRGYISCAFHCPFEKFVDPKIVSNLTKHLLKLGIREVSLGDTTGAATPRYIENLLSYISDDSISMVALHCHNTYGQALANILTGYRRGVRTFDSSISGLGGCPYAPGSSGNVSTEEVVYFFQGIKVDTGINFEKLSKASKFVYDTLGRCHANYPFDWKTKC